MVKLLGLFTRYLRVDEEAKKFVGGHISIVRHRCVTHLYSFLAIRPARFA
jgi:hypothetical protein